jgi:plasmid stabilization system protein ParE
MHYQVILSPLALDDLEQIVRYVASHDPQAAESLGNRLLDHAENLRDLPQRGSSVRSRPGVRKLLLWPYLIFYRVNEQSRTVEILRFWHGAQDPKQLRIE